MDHTRFEELLQLWQDGDATAPQLAEFEACLRDHPEARKALVGSVLLETNLYARYAGARMERVRPSRRRIFEAAAAILIVAVSAFAVGRLMLKEQPSPVQPFDGAAPAAFALSDGSRLELEAGSRGLLRSDDGLLELDRGRGRFAIGERPQPFRISTPGGTIQARGAEFSITLRPLPGKAPAEAGHRPEVVVDVRRGRVEVDSWGHRETVLAGDRRTFGPPPSTFALLLPRATVTLQDAIGRALAKAPGVAVRAVLEEDEGQVGYTVEIALSSEVQEVEVDARTGNVVDDENQKRDLSRLAGAAGITLTKAIESALQAVPGRAVEAELELEGGKALAEVKIMADAGGLREVVVDGVSGNVLNR